MERYTVMFIKTWRVHRKSTAREVSDDYSVVLGVSL